jgi:signal transduction histidine kinase
LIALSACKKPQAIPPKTESADFIKAEEFLNRQESDSAFYYFEKVAANLKDSLETATAYNYMATIQTDKGDHFGAQESLIISLSYLDEVKKTHRFCLGADYFELGLSSSRLKNYDAALSYFDSAYKYSDDDNYRLMITNSKANVYRRKGDYNNAIKLYEIVFNKNGKEGKEFPRVLSNLAYTKWLKNPSYNAAPSLLRALKIRQTLKDNWGINASYGHLADYYQNSQTDSAGFYSLAMLRIANKLKSPEDQMNALEKLIRLNDGTNAKTYFNRYYKLTDSLQTARNAAKNQFALIRYHSEKNKADNLELLKDNSDKKYELSQQRLRFYLMLFVFIIIVIIAIDQYNKRKLRQEAEQEAAIRETRQKASKKVHDTLANDIYRVMKQVEHTEHLEREKLVGDIDDIYQRARDISYDIMVNTDELFHEKIGDLLKSFANDTTRVILIGNEAELWERIDSLRKFELKYILQELMVNMQKHSKASNVMVKFELVNDLCTITYTDDGIGMPAGVFPKNGLTNTGNRINSMGGSINFDTNVGKGLIIQLSLPTDKTL